MERPINPVNRPRRLRNGGKTKVFLLYEGGEIAREYRNEITHVSVSPNVTEIPKDMFRD